MKLLTAIQGSSVRLQTPGFSMQIVMLLLALVTPILVFRLDFKISLLATIAAIVFVVTLLKKELSFFFPIVSLLVEFNYFPDADTKLGLSTAVLIVCIPSLCLYIYQKSASSYLQKIFFTFFAMSVATLFNDPGLAEIISLSQWIGAILFGCALLIFIEVDGHLNRVLISFTAVVTAIALGGLLQTRGLARFWIEQEYALGLPDSTLGYYSNFASFCAVMAIVTFGLTLGRNLSTGQRVFYLINFTILVTSVTLSLSRGAIVLLAVGLLGILLVNASSFRNLLLSALTALVAIVLVFTILPRTQLALFAQRFIETQSGDFLRFQLQAAGAKLLSENPLGIGLLSFSSQIEQNGLLADKGLSHAHNTFLQLGLNFGWLGLAAFAWLIFLCFRRFWKSLDKRVAAPFFFAIIAFLVQASQDYMLYETHNLLQVALIVALCLRSIEPSKREI